VLADHELDMAVFRRDIADGRAALRAGDAAGALDLFTRGLGLWRGAPLADVAGLSQVLGVAAAGLEEQRLAAVEDRADAMLAAGQHRELPGELAGLVAEHPLRERAQGLLMVALYRSGRQADALAAYQHARHRLAEELGIDPGPQLRDLHERILRADPALAAPARPVRLDSAKVPAFGRGGGRAGFAAATRTLPRTIASFTGRASELADLERAVTESTADGAVVGIHAIGGMAGIGKTTFAIHAAHRLAARFPDGQFFCRCTPIPPGSCQSSPSTHWPAC
jgi:hypothetical protein